MAAPKLDELLALDVPTRLALIARLWDSIVDDSQDLPITTEERALLDERLKEDDDDPASAIPWEVARTRLVPHRNA